MGRYGADLTFLRPFSTFRYADNNAAFGIYRAFGTVTGITHIKITKEDGQGNTPAGFAVYALIRPLQRNMWYTMRHQCGYYDRDCRDLHTDTALSAIRPTHTTR